MKRKGTLTFFVCMFVFVATQWRCTSSAVEGYSQLQEELEQYVSSCDAKIGVCVIVDSKDTIRINDDEAYPMNSVMKLYQAIATVSYMQEQGISLDSMLTIDKTDLHPYTYSPMSHGLSDNPCSISISISDVMLWSLMHSDNNACDILFNHILDVEHVEARIRNMGIDDFAIRVDENAMHQDTSLVSQNWNKPSAAAKLIDMLFTQEPFSGTYMECLQYSLLHWSTGENRLPKPIFRTDAKIAHKTGTGFPDRQGYPQGINDVGFVQLPNGQHYAISVFVKSSHTDMPNTEKMIADISRITYRNIYKNP